MFFFFLTTQAYARTQHTTTQSTSCTIYIMYKYNFFQCCWSDYRNNVIEHHSYNGKHYLGTRSTYVLKIKTAYVCLFIERVVQICGWTERKINEKKRKQKKRTFDSPYKMNYEEKCTGHDQIIGSNGPTSTKHNQSRHLKNSNETIKKIHPHQTRNSIIITSRNKIYRQRHTNKYTHRLQTKKWSRSAVIESLPQIR